jgi:hypothetical protein
MAWRVRTTLVAKYRVAFEIGNNRRNRGSTSAYSTTVALMQAVENLTHCSTHSEETCLLAQLASLTRDETLRRGTVGKDRQVLDRICITFTVFVPSVKEHSQTDPVLCCFPGYARVNIAGTCGSGFSHRYNSEV